MKYVLAPNNTFDRFILPGEVVQFSDRCNTTAKRLTDAEAAEYGVSKLKLVSPPAFDPLTQARTELPPMLIGGEWVQQWGVVALDAEGKIAAEQAARNNAKSVRASNVEAITVTTSTGKTFDGNETAQGRMSRAIIGLQAANVPSIIWTLADNTSMEVTVAELTEALILAGQEQARLWVI